ncbi:MAG: ribosome biogenesis GTPase YlqF [Bacillota bacterium]|jgi:ribosome biogenesis GTPase A
MSIQWFPGHMAKARRLLSENIKLVDVVVELRDARIPLSSANPLLRRIVGRKPRIIVLTKSDLADPRLTQQWLQRLEREEKATLLAVNVKASGVGRQLLPAIKQLAEASLPRNKATGAPLRPARTMVVGIPNVGKSSLINALAGRAVAKTGANPGVTRTKQWIKLGPDVELLDTPGLLWPRFEDEAVARRLAITGAVGTGGFDEYELASWLLGFLAAEFPELLARWRVEETDLPGYQLLEEVGRQRGCLMSGGRVDVGRAADIVLREFRTGKVGAVTLDPLPAADGETGQMPQEEPN